MGAAARWSSNLPLVRSPLRKIFPFGIGSSAVCGWACSWSKPVNTAIPASLRVVRWSTAGTFSPGNVTTRNSWGPNTLIKQGAKLTATREDVCEELPTELKLQLEAGWRVESNSQPEASLFADSQLSPHEKRIYALLKPDEATQLDELIERLEQQVSSSEVFSALFGLELAEKIKQLPGKNYVKSF